MDAYKLHSFGNNWFHFRKNLDSIMESFSITYCHDGTVCMTGDYGCLCWRREWFSGRIDYGFPNKQSGIGYFAGKVVRAEEDQRIEVYDRMRAIKEIDDAIANKDDEWSEDQIRTLKNVSDRMDYFEDGTYGQIQMAEAFQAGGNIESEYYCEIGIDYTDSFRWKYDLISSVSNLILEIVSKKDAAKTPEG